MPRVELDQLIDQRLRIVDEKVGDDRDHGPPVDQACHARTPDRAALGSSVAHRLLIRLHAKDCVILTGTGPHHQLP